MGLGGWLGVGLGGLGSGFRAGGALGLGFRAGGGIGGEDRVGFWDWG